ncbi:Putative OPA3-like protein [Sarcoptes scabiei]|uniref:Putative OPA3-like protein n=1 Tax=Sarcoptes scabiei TaxID=52283 RepID=A0A834RD74_SARSC|nr:Putative OPA3-like protein [Sarcoptes scabiei]UXI21695.1 short-chain dehydrogenase [Sarcoptes scabiei]
MAVGAFPLIKLAALAIRQISKPLANVIKTKAKNSPVFRNYICMPPAQMYHYFEVNVKMKLLGLGKPSNVNKLNETAAIELGAELLGESIIFIVAVLTLTAEYYRQSKKSAAEAVAIEERWLKLERKVQDLELIVEKHGAEIRSLTRLIHSSDYKKTDRNSPEESRSKKIIKII